MQRTVSANLRRTAAAAGTRLDYLAAMARLERRFARGISLAEMARRLYEERRERDRRFPPGLFGEPAWDLILALFVAREEGRTLSVRAACEAAGAAKTTGRRLLERLEAAGLIEIRLVNGSRKGRRVELTREGCDRVADYLTRIL